MRHVESLAGFTAASAVCASGGSGVHFREQGYRAMNGGLYNGFSSFVIH